MPTAPPLLALTLGDIAGVGPEIVARALADPQIQRGTRLAVFGPCKPLQRAIQEARLRVKVGRASSPAELNAWDFGKAIPVIDDRSAIVPPMREVRGRVDESAGHASHVAVVAAADACLAGHVEGMVTAPIHKAAWAAAGVKHPGHTEVLAERTGARNVVMMLAGPRIRVTLATIHVRLRDVPRRVTRAGLRTVIDVTARSMPLLGFENPRVAVAGLNPHAGDGGLFGDEEIRTIGPAIEDARVMGHDVAGPFPADTVFAQAKAGTYDVVVALYHDQGLVAVKTVDFERTVNISLGLPIIRTSVDHGTAFDIAGQGIANPRSLFEAIKLAARMARQRRRLAKQGGSRG